MLKPVIEIKRPLEISITHTCNLSCKGCLHFNDYKHNRFLTVEEVVDWLTPWSKIVQPAANVHNSLFNLLGGEPTLHKDLCEILVIARDLFPVCEFRLTTNGFFVKNHPKLAEVLYDKKIVIKISIHSKNPEYLEKCSESLRLVKEWEKDGVMVDWAELHTDYWQMPYIRNGDEIRPYKDNNPRLSWENCLCRSYQIFEKKVWKCPKIAYLSMQYEKYGHLMGEEWAPYLKYQGLSLEASGKEMKEFFAREEEYICGMCPNKINFFARESLPSPIKLTGKPVENFVSIDELVRKN